MSNDTTCCCHICGKTIRQADACPDYDGDGNNIPACYPCYTKDDLSPEETDALLASLEIHDYDMPITDRTRNLTVHLHN